MLNYSEPLNAEAKRSDVPFGHASMLLLDEGSEATEPYYKYAKYFSAKVNLLYIFSAKCRGVQYFIRIV